MGFVLSLKPYQELYKLLFFPLVLNVKELCTGYGTLTGCKGHASWATRAVRTERWHTAVGGTEVPSIPVFRALEQVKS